MSSFKGLIASARTVLCGGVNTLQTPHLIFRSRALQIVPSTGFFIQNLHSIYILVPLTHPFSSHVPLRTTASLDLHPYFRLILLRLTFSLSYILLPFIDIICEVLELSSRKFPAFQRAKCPQLSTHFSPQIPSRSSTPQIICQIKTVLAYKLGV